MAIVFEDISEDVIYNQIEKMAIEFIQEQSSGIGRKRLVRKNQNRYLWLLKRIRTDKSGNSKIFYIMINDKIIGFEVALIEYNNKAIGYKLGLYIKPEYRGHKIDKKFIVGILDKAVENWFEQKNIVIQRINTLETNTRQMNVYKRMGYKEIKRRNNNVYFEKHI